MIATEVRNYKKFSVNSFLNNGCDNFAPISPALTQESQNDILPVIKSDASLKVTKSFELVGKIISESYFEVDYSDTEFINDYSSNHKNGIILIMTEMMNETEINFFTKHLKDKLRYIIYYNGDVSQFNIQNSKGLTFIRTFSLKAAVAEAYRKVKDGQAIVFPTVEPNFDFFSYVDLLN